MALADKANQYIDEKKPWALAKIEGEEQQVHDVCSVGINLFRQLAVYLAPVSNLAAQVQDFLNWLLSTLLLVQKF
jgi:Methionyl-tRNA synthetase